MANGIRRTPNGKARASQYRQSDAGRLARQMYERLPEVKMKKAIRRKIKKANG